jgi:hypothetical protein
MRVKMRMEKTPPVNHNIEKWTAFCKNNDDAEQELQQKLLIVSQKKLVISTKKELVESNSHPQGLFIYKFCIVTAPKK